MHLPRLQEYPSHLDLNGVQEPIWFSRACRLTARSFADNGIGVAAALALLDASPSLKLPPLECLFTVDEETGLTGAFGLDPSLLSGICHCEAATGFFVIHSNWPRLDVCVLPAGKTMLNLDTEDWNEIFIGCAGGGDSVLTVPFQKETPKPSLQAVRVSVKGAFTHDLTEERAKRP